MICAQLKKQTNKEATKCTEWNETTLSSNPRIVLQRLPNCHCGLCSGRWGNLLCMSASIISLPVPCTLICKVKYRTVVCQSQQVYTIIFQIVCSFLSRDEVSILIHTKWPQKQPYRRGHSLHPSGLGRISIHTVWTGCTDKVTAVSIKQFPEQLSEAKH